VALTHSGKQRRQQAAEEERGHHRKIRNRAVTGKKIKLKTLGQVSKVKGHATFRTRRIVATDGPDQNAARDAAPEVKVFGVGPATIYAKCYTDTMTNQTYALFFLKTARNGVLSDSDWDDADGEPFLNTDTPETDRQLMYDYTGADSADVYMHHSDETVAMLPGGRARGKTSPSARRSEVLKPDPLSCLYGTLGLCPRSSASPTRSTRRLRAWSEAALRSSR